MSSWHRLNINADFIFTLRKYGRIPNSSLKEVMDVHKEHVEMKEEMKELKEKLGPCTFVKYGKESLDQNLYECSTCHIEGDKRVCEACLERCHKGHQAF